MNTGTAVLWGALFGASGVAAGAIGAHLLQERLAAEQMEQFEVAVRYQLVHALALLCVGLLAERGGSRCLTAAGGLFIAGVLLFCGFLFAYVATGGTVRPLVHVVPFGGLAFILGWLALAWHACCPPRTGN